MASNTEIGEILGKELKCYICKSGPKPGKNLQWYRCLSMHQICQICHDTKTENVKQSIIKKCLCSQHISLGYCKMTEAFLKSKSMRFLCENQERGCQQILSEESTILHESDCIYRLVKCPGIDCGSKVPVLELLEHMEKYGCGAYQPFSKKVGQEWVQTFGVGSKAFGKCLYPFKHELNGQVFFSVGKAVFDTFYWWVQMVGSKFEAKNYYYTLKLHGVDPEVRVVYSGQVFPIDETSDSITKGFKCLTIKIEALRSPEFIDSDQKFSYSVSIRNMKEEVKDDNEESGISDNE